MTYTALVKSLQCEWNFIQRVTPGCETAFTVLEETLARKFLPAVFGCEISNAEWQLFSLPARIGGLDVSDPTELYKFYFATSRRGCDFMVQAIRSHEKFEIETYIGLLSDVR